MKTKQKSILSVVIVLVILGVGIYLQNKDQTKVDSQTALACGLKVTSIEANSEVSFPLTVKGEVDNTKASNTGCSWSMFEGQAGIAQLYFKDDLGWVVLGVSSPIKVDEWMSEKTNFTTTLNFNNDGIGLKKGTIMKILFQEENPSGSGQVDSFELPLVLE